MPTQKMPQYKVDDQWRAEIRAALVARGWDQSDLARAAKVTHGAISQLLTGKVGASRHVPKIHAALGLPPPSSGPVVSEREFRWQEIYRRLDEGFADQLMAIAEAHLAKKG